MTDLCESQNDPCEDICDALVTAFNDELANNPETFDPITFQARKPANPKAELKLEHPIIQFLLVPYSDSEEKVGRPKYMEVHQVSLWIIRKLADAWTRERMSQVTARAKDFVRGKKMAGWTYGNAETVTKFDLTQLDEKNQFMSIVRLSYQGIR